MNLEEVETPPEGWPDCDPEQIEVMLLGTYHMDNPGLDEVNVESDDVLAPERQAELADLTDRLADWRPERIAVEWPYDWQAGVTALYEEYLSDARAYDDREEIDLGSVFDAEVSCRNEVVQVGFRLADQLDHDQVYPIDNPTDISNEELEALEERDFEPEKKVDFVLPNLEASKQAMDRQLAESTISEFLAWENQEQQLRGNHDLMFARGVRWGEGDNFGGPKMLSLWYDRNIRIVHNLWRAIEPGDDRVLLLVGSGHVRVLRHLLTEAPMFCPVSPLPYLS